MAAKKQNKDGKNYTEDFKQTVLGYVEQYNINNGRGGHGAAQHKYGVSAPTLSKWIKEAGLSKGRGKNAAPAPAATAKQDSALQLEIDTAKWLNKQGFSYELFQSLSSGAIDRKVSKSLEALGLFNGGDYTVARIGKGGEPVVELSLSKLLELTKTKV